MVCTRTCQETRPRKNRWTCISSPPHQLRDPSKAWSKICPWNRHWRRPKKSSTKAWRQHFSRLRWRKWMPSTKSHLRHKLLRSTRATKRRTSFSTRSHQWILIWISQLSLASRITTLITTRKTEDHHSSGQRQCHWATNWQTLTPTHVHPRKHWSTAIRMMTIT